MNVDMEANYVREGLPAALLAEDDALSEASDLLIIPTLVITYTVFNTADLL